MKHYYYSDGKKQLGPFSFEELKKKNISTETLIWFYGLEKWTPAKFIEEMKDIIELSPSPLDVDSLKSDIPLPPPLSHSNTIEKIEVISKEDKKEKKKMNKALATTLAVIACCFFYFVWFSVWHIVGDLAFGWHTFNDGGVLVILLYFSGFAYLVRLIWKRIRAFSK